MDNPPDAVTALEQLRLEVCRSLSNALRTLIETKHIYQRVTIDPAPMVERHAVGLHTSLVSVYRHAANRLLSQPVRLVDAPVERQEAEANGLLMGVETAKTFCTQCGSAEIASPEWYEDVVEAAERPASMRHAYAGPSHPTMEQVFALAYRCVRCKGEYDAYIVRRVRWQLLLHGRSPMEHLELPKFIPKAESHLYRDSLIALHGGKVLAALFYMRCFIEQFARRQTGISGRATGDEIMSAYAQTIPADQRKSMPSLKEQYDMLSEAIHEVREDEELATRTKDAMDRHFDFRRLFGTPEK